jgi:adenosylmethionine-8-amino-7-oxononanoate aminotransferase
MIASDRIMEPFLQGPNAFAHGYTFGGHPVSSAVALANLDIFDREQLNQHVLDNEGAFRARWRSCSTCRSSATSAATGSSTASSWSRTRRRGRPSTTTSRAAAARLPVQGAVRRGLYCRADDRGDPVVQLAPPLVVDQSHFDEMEQILRSVLSEAWTRL